MAGACRDLYRRHPKARVIRSQLRDYHRVATVNIEICTRAKMSAQEIRLSNQPKHPTNPEYP
jgi:hypothetical protein